MKTVSINVMNLCVPCENRCRYCLLSYDGKLLGVDYQRSQDYAKRFYDWVKVNRPDLSFNFGFGYSMEHPELLRAIRFCQSIGSATGEFLQFDGMKFRSKRELTELLSNLKANGVKLIDLTFYGTEEYHDRFAARKGDYRLMVDTLEQANEVGLDVSVSVPLSHENANQAEGLLEELDRFKTVRTVCFVPHSEGRGRLLEDVRLTLTDYEGLCERVKVCFNRERFRTEGEWVRSGPMAAPTQRVLTLTLTPENIDLFEHMDFAETISYLEGLDDTFYCALPGFEELVRLYGNPDGEKMYSARDLCMHYQRKYIAEHALDVYDVNDERQCFSRRV